MFQLVLMCHYLKVHQVWRKPDTDKSVVEDTAFVLRNKSSEKMHCMTQNSIFNVYVGRGPRRKHYWFLRFSENWRQQWPILLKCKI